MLTTTGYLLTLLGTLYALAALLCRPRTRRGAPSASAPITVLKPLCGMEPRLEGNLASLFEQTCPAYQIVFGVRERDDPAIDVVNRLAARYPRQDIALVIDARIHGSNFKVSNLINMMPAARHPWLVIADSDIAVAPDYLERVTAPLADSRVGIVTCLYRGRALGGFWTRLGALFIDTWFIPSVRVASWLGSSSFGFGATIALRAETLRAIGGFKALRNRLADDFWLGHLTREAGLATVLSDVCVTTDVTENDFSSLWSRERRWMQTICSVNPLGYSFSFVTFSFPVLAVGLWLAPGSWNWLLALIGMSARCALHWRSPSSGHAWLAPLRDCLLLLTWCSAFAGSRTRWRRQTVPIDTPSFPRRREPMLSLRSFVPAPRRRKLSMGSRLRGNDESRKTH
jgi:ceramide glucosyltransferase